MGLETVSAQDSTSVQSDYKNKVLLLPAIGSSPETGFMFGAVVVPQFKVGAADQKTRSSSIMMSAIYTTKNQILVSVLPDIILPEELWMLNGNYFVNYFPESYWGVGPFTTESNELTVLYTQINLEQNALRQIRPGFFAGPYLRWSKLYNLKFENTEGERVAIPGDIDAYKNIAAGIGWIARWDRRNSNMTPTENRFVQFSLLGNPSWLGNSRSFTFYELDARKYIPLSSSVRSVLAIQSLIQLNSGSPPFNDMAMVGGDRINRGYYGGRYRDQNSAQIQGELRQHAIGRFGFTVFAGTGEVWDRFDSFTLRNYKWTAGAGLRFNINKDDPTNVRIDFGVSKESVGFYLQFGEAF
ncbi:BamA/TamA family outer membrane protein [Fodinibius sp. Rm-B-1B1-1]|uniref:BamA/TamA family outer membrane protein n=1 Tax=Fodinibius alkaliphilus TaxID=3140241 RepID=UPI00315A76E2